MPKAVGLKRDEAIKLLKDTGLEVEVKEEYSDSVERDYVIKQETEDEEEVDQDEELPAGSKIIIYVSMGIEQVQVPDLSGKTEGEAKTAILNAKLKWKSTDKTSDSSKPNGVIVNQSISSGSMVDKNTEITITVNEFDEIKSATINVNVKSLLGGKIEYEDEEKTIIKDVRLKIMVGSDTIYDGIVSPTATKITATKSDKGSKEVKVYIDDLWKATKTLNFNNQTSITIE